jgi:predicted membrane channel-forming protein YqfA (hemolysin III family)
VGDDGTRLDRELNELLQELRVALPGVQVLFAFLLTVPFSQRFGQLTSTQRTAYFVAFLTAAAATALLLAPAAYHRIQWRQHDKERLLRTSTVLAIVGLGFLAAAMAAAAFVVADLLYETTWAAAVAAGVIAVLATFWFVLPLRSRLRGSQ